MTDNFAQPFADIVFNSTRDGVFITDAENHILAVNPAFSDITGFSREEVIGKSHHPEVRAPGSSLLSGHVG